MGFKHILVTTDLSQAAERAFPLAVEMARDMGAKITLLHIVEATRAIPHGAPFAPPMPAPGLERIMAHAKEACDEQAKAFGDLNVDTVVKLAGEVGPAVAAAVAQLGCDLVILSTHGRSGLRRLVLGSVAEAVLRHVHVPTLSVPPAAHDAR